MSKICTKCGISESDDAKYCHICGAPLVADNSELSSEPDFGSQFSTEESPSDPIVHDTDDFEYEFKDSAENSFNTASNTVNISFENAVQQPVVPITMDDSKANRLVKSLLSMTQSVFIICILRFIYMFIELGDLQDIKDVVPLFENTPLYAPLNTSIDLYYAGAVILALLLVATIAQFIFVNKGRKYRFPVQDCSVFEDSKKAFYVSIATSLIAVVYFIIEIIALFNNREIEKWLEEEIMTWSELAVALVFDCIIVAMAVGSMVSALRISRCKK